MIHQDEMMILRTKPNYDRLFVVLTLTLPDEAKILFLITPIDLITDSYSADTLLTNYL